MKHYIFAGLAAVLIAGELIGSAPQANAGCQYGDRCQQVRWTHPARRHLAALRAVQLGKQRLIQIPHA
jgi:hypothetical protein